MKDLNDTVTVETLLTAARALVADVIDDGIGWDGSEYVRGIVELLADCGITSPQDDHDKAKDVVFNLLRNDPDDDPEDVDWNTAGHPARPVASTSAANALKNALRTRP